MLPGLQDTDQTAPTPPAPPCLHRQKHHRVNTLPYERNAVPRRPPQRVLHCRYAGHGCAPLMDMRLAGAACSRPVLHMRIERDGNQHTWHMAFQWRLDIAHHDGRVKLLSCVTAI